MWANRGLGSDKWGRWHPTTLHIHWSSLPLPKILGPGHRGQRRAWTIRSGELPHLWFCWGHLQWWHQSPSMSSLGSNESIAGWSREQSASAAGASEQSGRGTSSVIFKDYKSFSSFWSPWTWLGIIVLSLLFWKTSLEHHCCLFSCLLTCSWSPPAL